MTPVDPAADDAYARLFRPDEPDASPPLPAAAPAATPSAAAAPAPAMTPAATATSSSVDTGRLFRSARVEGDTQAVAAVAPTVASSLRTLQPADGPAPIRVTSAEPRPAATLLVGTSPAPDDSTTDTPRRETTDMPRERHARGLRPIGVYGITIGATIIAGAIDIVVGGAGLGLVTGIVLLLATVFCALRVRRADASVAVIAPPIAFLLAALTTGQIGQSSTGGFLGRIVNTFFMLADNWVWIIGSTVVALVIVLVRGRLSR